ncbi:integral membrane sensor signal transduction histidine kinase [Paenibacillus terrae HPL-003]|uniref:histidine kinase n=1 Tax=Paenibacillus terrae (strain HPL-003) TaxID=985665 RepID=G7W3B9_PAETH|nr:histidine kinase [Paenibacillus terrae]AET57382.1 integral membrane sensor signal transduction histidine kinase [Paenibacillus terrae HPL-003]
MTYNQIKWMILFVPTLTVGAWEYVRHQFLLPYISMDLGNWLTPIILYLVSVTLLTKLFHMLERIQMELQHERAAKAALEAREDLAKELHDGIAQSLFLLSVKMDRLEHNGDQEQYRQDIYKVRKTVHEVNRYVRQAIANLRFDPTIDETQSTNESMDYKVQQMIHEIPVNVDIRWTIPDDALTPKEKVELLACIREAVVNIEKHAGASKGWIIGEGDHDHWKVIVKDNGKGFTTDPFRFKDRYGLNIMKERAKDMSWTLQLLSDSSYTTVEITKEGEHK